jgi:serine/threonine protein kinase/WD40 repeat protein
LVFLHSTNSCCFCILFCVCVYDHLQRIRLKCRYDNEIRIVIISPDYTFSQLYQRLTLDYGFDISLKYEDQDGDLITLTSQNDFEDLLMAESDVVNVIVSENMLPSLLNKRQPKVASLLWSQGAPPSPGGGVSWAKEQHQHHHHQHQQRSQSPFLHAPTPLASNRHGSSNRLLERFPQIESSVTPRVTERHTRWKRGEILGQGAFGVVYLGLNVESGELMAVKQINNDELKSKELSSLENEINILRSLKHPNIVRYIGTESNANTLSIFLEYVPGGSLKSLIDKFGKLEESVVRLYTRQLLLGLEYLHRNGIAHRDIKGANCLVGNDGAVKLADFGASNSWRSPVESKDSAVAAAQESNSHDVKGTPSWMPPEVIRGEKPLNWKKADVWSLGCTTIEMTTGRPPWSQFNNPVTVLYHIACSEAVPEYPEDPSIELLTFLNSCLKRDHNERTDITSLLLHPFVASLQAQGGGGGGGGGGGWSTGSWGQRPSTVSTTPAGEWEDTISQWKDFTPHVTVSDSSSDVKSTLATTAQAGDGMMQANSSTPALLESSSQRKPSRGDLSDLDMESTVSRHHVIDTNSIVRAHSSRTLMNTNTRKQSIKSHNIMSDNLSPVTIQDYKKEEDREQINDLLSVASLENSIETFPDDLDDSTSTLGSGRVILESLDGVGSSVLQDDMKCAIYANRNITDVKISPINDAADDDANLLNNSKRPNIINQKSLDAKVTSKDVILRRSLSSTSKSNKKGKSVGGTSKQGANKQPSSIVTKDKSKIPPQSLMSPVKQPPNSTSFTQNLELKLANGNNEKVIEKVIKPLSRMASAGGVDTSPSSTNKKKPPPPPSLQTTGSRAQQTPNSSTPTTVPASPIRISSLTTRTKPKPFEYSTLPGEKPSVSSGSDSKSKNANKKAKAKMKSASSTHDSFEQVPDEMTAAAVFTSSLRSNTDEIKDEAVVHNEEEDVSVADDVSDDSGVHMGDIAEEEQELKHHGPTRTRLESDDMMEFSSSSIDNSMAGFDWLSTTNAPPAGVKSDWTGDSFSKDKKYGVAGQTNSPSPSKQRLGQSQSTSSVPTSDNISDPNIGMYALVGHSLKQGSAPSGSVQGTRIKTSLPSSKQTLAQRNTKSSLGPSSVAKPGPSRGGETSAFRSLKIAGDSIDLRLGTGAAGTPLPKNGGERFFDNSLDGFGMEHDDKSEDSITLPLHSVAEELNEHTAAVTKLRMIHDRNVFISASLDSSIRIWGTEGSTASRAVLDIPSFDSKAKKAMPTTSKPLKFCGLWVDQNCDFIWGGCSDGIIRVWNGGEGRPHRMVKGHEDLVTNIEGAPLEYMSVHTCASASLDKTARVWDTRAKKAQCALFRGHTDTIYSLKWLDGGRSVATASKDKTIKVWDVRTGRYGCHYCWFLFLQPCFLMFELFFLCYRLQITLDKHYGTVNLLKTLPADFKIPTRKDSVSTSSGGGNLPASGGVRSCFLSAARDGIMSLWTSDGTCLASQGAHRTAVTCMSEVQSHSDLKDVMHVSGPCVVTSGMDSMVRVWDIRRMKIASEFSLPHVVKVAWFNQSVITGSSTGEMYIWDYYEEGGGGGGDDSRKWNARELTHHSHQCSDIVTSKYCVASASKSGKILRYSAM